MVDFQGERCYLTRMKVLKRTSKNSEELKAIQSLIDRGKVHWFSGKPAGLNGIGIQGKSLAETLVEERFDPLF